MEGNLPFKIDWDSLIVGRKFIFFALFYFVFEGNFQVQALGGGGGGLCLEGRFRRGSSGGEMGEFSLPFF